MVDRPAQPAAESRIWAAGFAAAAMLTLVAAMAASRRPTLPAGRLDPAVWWHLGRASGLIAWALLGVAVIGGMAMSTRLAGRRTRSWTHGVHEFISVLAVAFTAVHLTSVLASHELDIGLLQLTVPFTRAAGPLAQACGVLACYLLIAVAATSWMRGLMPWRWWRRLHLLSFPLFVLACAHTVLAGSDTDHPLFIGLSAAAGVVMLALLLVRLLPGRRGTPVPARPSPSPSTPLTASPPDPPVVRRPGDLSLLITRVTWEADAIVSLRLSSPDRTPLPPWQPGAHLQLVLPSGRVRHYSLFGDPTEPDHYTVAVLHQESGRGGSREIHTELRAGMRLVTTAPRNDFPLEPAPCYLFLAGGIGITGVLAMAATVAAAGGDWELVYGGRTRPAMAFADQLQQLDPDRVEIVAHDEHGHPDLDAVLARQRPGTAVYCCGPEPMLRAVAERTAARPDLTLHVERFAPAAPAGGSAVRVELRRTGTVVDVAAGRTILQAVRDVVPSAAGSCEQGICGTCITTVLAGEPDHRDTLLSDAQRAGGQMLICVSRAVGDRLILDL